MGLTNNPAALKRWVTVGSEIACLVSSFEHQYLLSQDRLKDHHEQIPSVQNAFTRDVDALVSAFEEAGNPFEDDGECLFALDTNDIVEELSTTTVQNILAKGEQQFNDFTTDKGQNPLLTRSTGTGIIYFLDQRRPREQRQF